MNISVFIFCVIATLSYYSSPAFSHSVGSSGMMPMDWKTEQINHVYAFYPIVSLGDLKEPRVERINDKECLIASRVGFDVLDEFAHDIDEPVTIDVEFYLGDGATDIVLSYDKSGNISAHKNVTLPEGNDKNRWFQHSFTLDRARFSGRRIDKFSTGDFSLGPKHWAVNPEFTICDIHIKRSYASSFTPSLGRLSLKITDETGEPIQARVGIYDDSGRMPLPSDEAIPVRYFSSVNRSLTLHDHFIPWPASNRRAFYINKKYQASLPEGRYSIVVGRGLEYRFSQREFLIEHGKETSVEIKLSRWKDMPSQGWYSGDVHIHSGRAGEEESKNILLQMQAEDLNVANLLQSGNIGSIYFGQHSWVPYEHAGGGQYALVPGQEDPRTTRLGHTIQLKIDKPIRNPERYYLYHEVFEQTKSQGGLAGYAHGGGVGLALDLPYGLIDIIEVLQAGNLRVDGWFDALNLGYKISPVAGTDYPYIYGDLPGSVRNYVQVGEDYSTQGWFEGLKVGRTFVTNGPILEFTINEQEIGSDVKVEHGDILSISAKAALNPDIGKLDKIELIQQGEVVSVLSAENDARDIVLQSRVPITTGSWFVVRAQGKKIVTGETIVAISAPIYVYAGGKGFCKISAVLPIVERFQKQLDERLDQPLAYYAEAEPWDVWGLKTKYWPKNKILLEKRIDKVNRKYSSILALARQQRCISDN